MPRFLPNLRRQLAKAIYSEPSTEIEVATAAQGLDYSAPFSPGEPLHPFSGFGGEPRRFQFPTGYNIQSRPVRDQRVSFKVLKDLIDNYDIARMAIGHRIDDVRSLEWALVPKRGFTTDAEALMDRGYEILKYPEGPGSKLPFRAWLAKYLEDVLRYDAGTLFRRRDRIGRVIGLKVVSGTTIAPTLDYWGDTPIAPAPAYVQFVEGIPWKWFTTDDLIYVPFRPQSDSPYGFAPLESILLTANTDIRFQMHFLRYFTEGSLPYGFATLPESISSPDQIEEYQTMYDALMMGDEGAKHQLRFVPFGTTFDWPRNEHFDDKFPTYLMRKVAAAYHVTPNDLGFTDDVNRSTSESQVDVQFRVGTLPLVQHIQDILDSYLQDDRGLPLEFRFDTGQETDDRVSKAQAHKIYVEMGAESISEVRTGELGLEEDNERPVPRFIFSPRTGPVPLTSLYAIAGQIDPETAAPVDDVPLSTVPFEGTPGLLADRAPGGTQFTRAESNPDEPEFPALEHPVPGTDVLGTKPASPVIGDPGVPVVKEETSGVTAGTGIVGQDLIGDKKEQLEKEQAQFLRFVKSRRRAGKWRDFEFTATDALTAHRLNDQGRASVRKAAGDLVAAGLVVRAQDTGRILMLQRALDEDDAAAGRWEFPGGHIEDGETPYAAACREWCEETGLQLPEGLSEGSWVSSTGIYAGYVYSVVTEALLPVLSGRDLTSNPDDPDGDSIEALAWWDPALLEDNPAVRDELAQDLDRVYVALTTDVPLTKGSAWEAHPVRRVEDALVDAHTEPIRQALEGSLSRSQLTSLIQSYMARHDE